MSLPSPNGTQKVEVKLQQTEYDKPDEALFIIRIYENEKIIYKEGILTVRFDDSWNVSWIDERKIKCVLRKDFYEYYIKTNKGEWKCILWNWALSPDGQWFVSIYKDENKKVHMNVFKYGEYVDSEITTDIEMERLADVVSFPANDEIILRDGDKEHVWKRNDGYIFVWEKIR